jgi:hypothetical protein
MPWFMAFPINITGPVWQETSWLMLRVANNVNNFPENQQKIGCNRWKFREALNNGNWIYLVNTVLTNILFSKRLIWFRNFTNINVKWIFLKYNTESPVQDEEHPHIKYVVVLLEMKSRFIWSTHLESKEAKPIAGNQNIYSCLNFKTFFLILP